MLATVLFSALAGWSQPATAERPACVGSEVCQGCHQDIAANFFRNAHFRSIASGKEAPERTGCEGCHGPGQAHVAARGGKHTIARTFSGMTSQATVEACLACHAKDLAQANIRRSEHTQHDVACTDCHSIHHAPAPKFLLAKKQSELCYSCHPAVRSQFAMPSKHHVNEGAVQCSDCHNPHGSYAATWGMGGRSHMVETALGSESPCLKCHVDLRGPFVYEHASVRVAGCQSCHFAHGSTNSRLLRRPVMFTLCLECHNGGASGTRNQGVELQSSRHNLLDPKYRQCTVCHVRIHGSNANAYLLR